MQRTRKPIQKFYNCTSEVNNFCLTTNNRITTLTSDFGEDLSTSAEIADSLNTYFQSVFVKEKTVEEGLPHFASRTCTSCNDDGKVIFKLETLHRAIDNLKDNKAIGVDKASPIILKRCKAALSRPLLPEEFL